MKALLVIDMLVDFIDPQGALYIGPAADKLVPAVKARLEQYRKNKAPVVFICDNHLEDDKEFVMFPPHSVKGSGGDEIIAPLTPMKKERIIYKRRYSAFFGTDLDLTLRERGINDLELTGCLTNICVLYTAAEARALNYDVSVVEKAVASVDPEVHRFALQEMEKTLGVNLIHEPQ